MSEPLYRSEMFAAVSEMNEAFGNAKGNPRAIDWERITNQCANIGAEFKELMDALGLPCTVTLALDRIGEASPLDARDALCDIMVFALGAYHLMGIDADRDMLDVVEGVMTRFCKTREELELTVQHYARKGVEVSVHGTFPRAYVRSTHDQQMPEYPKGKFLKSIGYTQTKFHDPTDVVGDMARQRAQRAAVKAEQKRIRDLKITAYMNELLAADGEATVNAHEEMTAGGKNVRVVNVVNAPAGLAGDAVRNASRRFLGQRAPGTGDSASLD